MKKLMIVMCVMMMCLSSFGKQITYKKLRVVSNATSINDDGTMTYFLLLEFSIKKKVQLVKIIVSKEIFNKYTVGKVILNSTL